MYYEVVVQYLQITEDGTKKKKRSVMLVDAMTFTEAEQTALIEVESWHIEFPDVCAIKRSAIREVANEDDWAIGRKAWKVKVAERYTLDNGKEKVMKYPVLFWSDEMLGASSKIVQEYVESIGNMKPTDCTMSPIECVIKLK